MKHFRKYIKTLPVKLFYELWESSTKFNTKNEYRVFILSTNSKYRLCYKKRGLSYDQFLEVLDNIYDASHMSINDIIKLSGMKKSEIGYMFCIKQRTMESWCYGASPCPDHIRLMLLRYFNLFKLGNHIYLEPEEPVARIKNENQKEEQESREEDLPLITMHQYQSMRAWEQEHVHSSNNEVKNLLDSLKYLDNYKK